MQQNAACILAAIGFACVTCWGTYAVFSPALPILSFLSIEHGVGCLVASRIAAVAALAFCALRPHVVYDRLERIIAPGTAICFLPAIAAGVAGQLGASVPLPIMYAVWLLCGVGELTLAMPWITLIAMLQARYIAITIAVGGAIATPLFLFLVNIGGGVLQMAGVACVVGAGAGISTYLARASHPSLPEPSADQQGKPALSTRGALSVAVHGVVYGILTMMLGFIGHVSIVVAGCAGLVSSLIAIVWARRVSKTHWTTASIQRVTIPLVVLILLFIPFCGNVGRTALGALAIAAFAYTTLMEWTEESVASAEFQIFPIKTYALGSVVKWSGFAIGVVIAFIVFHSHPLDDRSLMFVMSVLAVVTVATYAAYSAEDTRITDEVFEIITDEGRELVIDPPKNAAPFRDRCEALAKRYELSPRETEVFVYLAKGRNAEYIQQKLFISANTVKSHIFHIYKKMGISSQQRLIDLVDERDLRAE